MKMGQSSEAIDHFILLRNAHARTHVHTSTHTHTHLHTLANTQDAQHVDALEALLVSVADTPGRRLLLTVIMVSSPEVQAAIVRGRTVALLGAWVTSAVSLLSAYVYTCAFFAFFCFLLRSSLL